MRLRRRQQRQQLVEATPTPWTPVVWLVLWVSAMVGMLKGYSSGAGVLYSTKFRRLWFPQERLNPSVLTGMNLGDAVCVLSDLDITWFLATKYVVGAAASLPVGWVIRSQGRRLSILLGLAAYSLAHLLQGAAVQFGMLITSQVFHGIAAAFLYQAPYMEIVEIAPHQWRGAFVFCDPLGRAIGVWTRSLLHAGLGGEEFGPSWGWRLSSLFPLWPALVVMMLVPWIPETPNSLIQRGKLEAGRAALQEIRGPLHDVDDEFDGILKAAGIQNTTKRPPWQLSMLFSRQQLPSLLLMLLITVLREFMGADTVRLFGRTLWEAMHWMPASIHGLGLEQIEAALYLVAVVGSILAIDTWGRRPVLSTSAIGCGLGCVAVAAATMAEPNRGESSAAQMGIFAAMLLTIMSYVFGWSGGYWLLMVELFPLTTRPLAASLFTGLVMLCYSVTSLFALDWVCSMQSSMALVYGAGNLVLLLLVIFLLPETRRLALEDVHKEFDKHWLWRHFKQHEQPRDTKAAGAYAGTARGPTSGANPGHALVADNREACAPQQQPQRQQPLRPSAFAEHAVVELQLQHSSSMDGIHQRGAMHSEAARSTRAGPGSPAAPQRQHRAAARALSMQAAGTMSLNLDDFMYGTRR